MTVDKAIDFLTKYILGKEEPFSEQFIAFDLENDYDTVATVSDI